MQDYPANDRMYERALLLASLIREVTKRLEPLRELLGGWRLVNEVAGHPVVYRDSLFVRPLKAPSGIRIIKRPLSEDAL
jgi:hypothetical protein